MKRLQAISHRSSTNQDISSLGKEMLSALKEKMGERGYRADLSLHTAAKSTVGRFGVQVKYSKELGYPSENDLITIVAQAYPNHDINWETIDAPVDGDVVIFMLEPSMEVVPVESVKHIPPEFTPIGTALYKRAADASGKINEIWTLKNGDNGLALYRTQDDIEVMADANEIKAGDAVETEHGIGIVKRFDELGNAFVQVGNKTHLICASEMKPYSTSKDKAKLEDYYATAYGSPEYGKKMTEEYGDKKKK